MFKDVGGAIYIVGVILFWSFIAAGAICLLLTITMELPSFMWLSAIFGAFVFALPLCGFGQLVQDVAALAYKSSIQPEIIYQRR